MVLRPLLSVGLVVAVFGCAVEPTAEPEFLEDDAWGATPGAVRARGRASRVAVDDEEPSARTRRSSRWRPRRTETRAHAPDHDDQAAAPVRGRGPPDDEFASWSLIEKSSANYPVFIVLTHGEQTGYCAIDGQRHWQSGLGRRAPARRSRGPAVARRPAGTRGSRRGIASWTRWPGGPGAVTKPGFPRYRPRWRRHVSRVGRREVGAHRVRSGDGRLTASAVTRAIQAVRGRRGQLCPLTREYGVIGASYSNTRRDPGCDVYEHADHRAVHVALWSTNQGTPGPQWGRTCVNDPDVRATGGRVEDVDADTYRHAMAVDAPAWDPVRYPNARRLGAFQVHYGWLRPAFWEATGRAGRTQFDRRQAFWKRF